MADQWGRKTRPGDSYDIGKLYRGWTITYDSLGNQLTAKSRDYNVLSERWSRTGRTASVLGPLRFRPMSGWQNSSSKVDYLSNTVQRWRDDASKGFYMDVKEENTRFLTSPMLTKIYDAAGLNSTGRADLGKFPIGRAETEALIKLGDRKIGLGEAILEARSSLYTAVHLSVKAFKLIKYARRGQWNNIRKNLGLKGNHTYVSKRFADQWLEYSYGIMPIISDATDAWNLYQEGLTRKPLLLSVVRNVNETRRGDYSDSTIAFDYVARTRTSCKLYARVNSTWVDNVARLGLLNPIELAWAATPFSFVIDWLVPVGDFLEASTARVGLSFVDGSVSAKSDWTAAFNLPLPNPSGLYSYTGAVMGRAYGSAYNRRKLYSFPNPTIWMESPFSTRRVVSAIALLRQLM